VLSERSMASTTSWTRRPRAPAWPLTRRGSSALASAGPGSATRSQARP
jgi:hypothetical protein